MKVTEIPIVIGALGTIRKGLVKRLDEVENRRTSGDHPNYNIVEVGQNTSLEDLRRVAITQTPVKDNLLTLVWKTRKEWYNSNKGICLVGWLVGCRLSFMAYEPL